MIDSRISSSKVSYPRSLLVAVVIGTGSGICAGESQLLASKRCELEQAIPGKDSSHLQYRLHERFTGLHGDSASPAARIESNKHRLEEDAVWSRIVKGGSFTAEGTTF